MRKISFSRDQFIAFFRKLKKRFKTLPKMKLASMAIIAIFVLGIFGYFYVLKGLPDPRGLRNY